MRSLSDLMVSLMVEFMNLIFWVMVNATERLRQVGAFLGCANPDYCVARASFAKSHTGKRLIT